MQALSDSYELNGLIETPSPGQTINNSGRNLSIHQNHGRLDNHSTTYNITMPSLNQNQNQNQKNSFFSSEISGPSKISDSSKNTNSNLNCSTNNNNSSEIKKRKSSNEKEQKIKDFCTGCMIRTDSILYGVYLCHGCIKLYLAEWKKFMEEYNSVITVQNMSAIIDSVTIFLLRDKNCYRTIPIHMTEFYCDLALKCRWCKFRKLLRFIVHIPTPRFERNRANSLIYFYAQKDKIFERVSALIDGNQGIFGKYNYFPADPNHLDTESHSQKLQNASDAFHANNNNGAIEFENKKSMISNTNISNNNNNTKIRIQTSKKIQMPLPDGSSREIISRKDRILNQSALQNNNPRSKMDGYKPEMNDLKFKSFKELQRDGQIPNKFFGQGNQAKMVDNSVQAITTCGSGKVLSTSLLQLQQQQRPNNFETFTNATNQPNPNTLLSNKRSRDTLNTLAWNETHCPQKPLKPIQVIPEEYDYRKNNNLNKIRVLQENFNANKANIVSNLHLENDKTIKMIEDIENRIEELKREVESKSSTANVNNELVPVSGSVSNLSPLSIQIPKDSIVPVRFRLVNTEESIVSDITKILVWG